MEDKQRIPLMQFIYIMCVNSQTDSRHRKRKAIECKGQTNRETSA